MDPVAHTIVGACLAETGLARRGPLTTATLLIGVNLPDVDAVTYFVSGDVALLVRRGWTHGVLAMATLPLLLTGIMLVVDRWRRRSHPDAPRARWRWLLAMATLAILSHPALDWLNSYGVRLLLPFDDRWFYGDALYIIDPWFWLIAATPVVLAQSRGRMARFAWVTAAVIATIVLVRVPAVPIVAQAIWFGALAGLVVTRWMRGPRAEAPIVARAAVAVLMCYVTAMVAGARLARADVADWTQAQRMTVEGIAALPVPANPFARDVIVVLPDRYVFALVDWLASPRVRFSNPAIARSSNPGPIVSAALSAPQARGLRGWMRFPAYEIHPLPHGFRVLIQDVRFSRMRKAGIGYMVVDVDPDLRPVEK